MLCKKNEKNCINATRRAPNRARHFFCLYAALVCGVCFALPAFADGDPLTVVNNLSTFIFSLIRAIGLILLGWGIVQVGLSLQSHDPSQRSQGFLTLAGGLVAVSTAASNCSGGISHACGRAGHYVCKRNLGLDHGHGGIKSRQRIVKPKPRG